MRIHKVEQFQGIEVALNEYLSLNVNNGVEHTVISCTVATPEQDARLAILLGDKVRIFQTFGDTMEIIEEVS